MSSNTAAVSKDKPDKSSSKGPSSSSSSSTARPLLKNLTRARIPKAGLMAAGLITAAAISWKALVSDRHKRENANFYRSYDPERDYARMKSAGVFKTLADRERPEWLDEYESELDQAIEALRSPGAKGGSKKKSRDDDD